MKKLTTYRLALCALFAALTAVAAQLSIPVGPIPISLATLAVYLAGGVLGAGAGTLSQVVYLLLGAAGLPVFAGFHGGLSTLAGPTGGYLIGYVVCAAIVGAGASRFGRKPLPLVLSMVVGTLALYALGTAWFCFLTKRGLTESLALCVYPFLLGDAAKIAVSAFLIPQLFRAAERIGAKGKRTA